ncbi:MAG: arginine--tRNA ligase [Oscillospiraceae bacterium]|nr:arginine--tRNA ligase [Oscillospiraceae bacterium]
MLDQLSAIAAAAFAQCGFEPTLGRVILSNRPQLCQFQCDGAMKGAKALRRPPLEIARAVADVLAANPVFASVDVAPPGFINLNVTDEFLLQSLTGAAGDARLGVPADENPRMIVLDYCGPNVAKPLHVGHLRPAIIGESLKRLMKFIGHKVIADNHLGDWGLQMGQVIAQLEELGVAEADITAELLCDVYPQASARSKTEPEFRKKAQDYTVALQQRDPEKFALWEKIVETSCVDFRENFAVLGVSYDYWYGESYADQFIPAVLDILKQQNLLRLDNGAQVVDVTQEDDNPPMPPAIIIKSDGAYNYETTDVATIHQRVQEFAPDEIWYVVDKRQALHFKQVFRVAHNSGIAPAALRLSHIGNGTMNGSDGRPFKTRDGGTMRLSDLLEQATAQAMEKIANSTYIAEQDKADVARKIAVASIKFGDLSNHWTKDYIFDLQKFLSFEGKTGSYILYTLARINSILGKASDDSPQFTQLTGDAERELAIGLLLTGQQFAQAAAQQAPNFVAESAYTIAVAFAKFYHDSNILGETCAQARASRLALCKLTRDLLLLHLDILGIEAVEAM